MKLKIQECSFHRNGVGGLGFYAIRFQWKPLDADEPENFLATLFDQAGACAVISLDRIEKCGVAFAQGNSWRGDHFEKELRRCVKKDGLTTGARIGPFYRLTPRSACSESADNPKDKNAASNCQ